MPKPSDLALRPDIQLGPMLVSPSRRLVAGPGGEAHLEPLIMQVFLLLLDACGRVVTRNQLFDECWGGAIVGDDSLNRAVGKVRRIAEQVAPGLLTIETIPRTGYRLSSEDFGPDRNSAGETHASSPSGVSRRMLLGTATAAGVAAIGGLGLWAVRRSRTDRQFDELMARAEHQFQYGSATSSAKAAEYLRAAAAIDPDDARCLGLLAYALSDVAERGGEPRQVEAAVSAAHQAAREALAIQTEEPNARLALVALERSMLDFAATEDRLRAIVADDPKNILAMRHLWNLMQSTGRSRDAYALVEQAIAIEPLAAFSHYPRAQLLWILGSNAEADRVIDRAMEFWPDHPFVRFARFIIFAFTGRSRAAQAMLENPATKPQTYTPAQTALWRVSLAALDERSPTSIAMARTANLEAAKEDPGVSSQAILVLSGLGEVDAAFEIANDLLLFRRPVEPGAEAAANHAPVKSTSWRFTPWLFTPPVKSLRADPRFNSLCEGIGLTDYWAKRGVKPDYQLGIA
jgi:DNA-binding winged helix-turn-helix (wHTH) protein/tetratricopeptide (TPR) repeat protein